MLYTLLYSYSTLYSAGTSLATFLNRVTTDYDDVFVVTYYDFIQWMQTPVYADSPELVSQRCTVCIQ
jgi:hypothetical protein